MKRTLTALVALAALGALALTGCGSGDDQKVTAQQVKKEAKEAVNTAVAYSKQKQEEWFAQAQAQYQELEKETSQLMDKAKEKAAAGQDKAKDILADLQKWQAVAQEKLKAMQSASGEAWEKAKVELDEALQNLKQAYLKAKAELTD